MNLEEILSKLNKLENEFINLFNLKMLETGDKTIFEKLNLIKKSDYSHDEFLDIIKYKNHLEECIKILKNI